MRNGVPIGNFQFSPNTAVLALHAPSSNVTFLAAAMDDPSIHLVWNTPLLK